MVKEKKRLKIPEIKKEISAFLVGEEGKISKQSLLKAGAVLGGIALASSISVKGVDAHSESWNVNELSLGHYNSGQITSTHGSHRAHESGGWC